MAGIKTVTIHDKPQYNQQYIMFGIWLPVCPECDTELDECEPNFEGVITCEYCKHDFLVEA